MKSKSECLEVEDLEGIKGKTRGKDRGRKEATQGEEIGEQGEEIWLEA